MHIIILKGPPASGKSTWRKEFIANNAGWEYVNLDELRLLFPNMPEHERIQEMFDRAHYYLDNRKNLIVDNTNLNPKMVERWRNIARQYNAEVEIKEFSIPFPEAVRRDLLRPNRVGKSVIWKMYVDAGLNPMPNLDRKIPAIVFDIDGTIANVEHRRHYVADKPKQWDKFFAAAVDDTPVESVKIVYAQFAHDDIYAYSIIFLSGRKSEYRKDTETWLENHGFNTYDLLLMRGFNDKRDDYIVKEEIYRNYVEPWYDVKIVFDDRDSVVNMWRSIGLSCFQVAPGNF